MLQAKGRYWFLRQEIQHDLGLSDSAINTALWRMTQKKALCRIRGECYLLCP